jgi:uncharacterized protein (DUF924 family)
MIEAVLSFWFEETRPAQWWSASDAFDQLIAQRFGALHRAAAQAELFAWRTQPRGRLAEVIVLDQFSRNLHRGSPLAFACDPMALALAQEALAAGADQALAPVEQSFLCMPFMHSESRLIHVESESLFRQIGLQGNLDSALQHKAIIDRFGRYPHRNAVLGRASTAEELAFLEQPGSRF